MQPSHKSPPAAAAAWRCGRGCSSRRHRAGLSSVRNQPAVRAALELPRKEPADYFQAIGWLIDLGRPELAKPILDELAKLQLTDAAAGRARRRSSARNECCSWPAAEELAPAGAAVRRRLHGGRGRGRRERPAANRPARRPTDRPVGGSACDRPQRSGGHRPGRRRRHARSARAGNRSQSPRGVGRRGRRNASARRWPAAGDASTQRPDVACRSRRAAAAASAFRKPFRCCQTSLRFRRSTPSPTRLADYCRGTPPFAVG